MAKKKEAVIDYKSEFITAIEELAKEKEIDKETLFEAIESSLVMACKREFGKSEGSDAKKNIENVRVDMNRQTGEVHVFMEKVVAKEVTDDSQEISEAEAELQFPGSKVGDTVSIEVTPKDFSRIATQQAKQVVVQKIREEEKRIIQNQYETQEHSIITGIVQRYSNGTYTINIGKIDAILTPKEQAPGEEFSINERIRVYVKGVKETAKGIIRVIISRSDEGFVKKLFENEVAEIQDGIVEIKSISREPGVRTKIAVTSYDPDVDAVGACVGVNGERVEAVVDELRGEKIDIVEWSEDPTIFIENALSPSKVVDVRVEDDENERKAEVIVPDHQLSLAIGKEGLNAKLAARLTKYKIDIKSESQAY